MRRVSKLVFLVASFTFVVAPISSAHTTLLSSVPAVDAELTQAPTAVELEFGEDLIALGKGTKVSVIAPSGKDIAIGEATVMKTHVSQPLSVDSTPGVFTVKFRVVAADGHVLEDTFAFTVTSGQSATTAAAPVMKPTTPGSSEEELAEGSGEVGSTNRLLPIALIGVALVAIYGVVRRIRKK